MYGVLLLFSFSIFLAFSGSLSILVDAYITKWYYVSIKKNMVSFIKNIKHKVLRILKEKIEVKYDIWLCHY